MTSSWTGHQLLVWGGIGGTDRTQMLADGATYDPSTNTWQTLPASPLVPRWGAVAANTPHVVVIVGGYGPTTSDPSARGDGAIVLTQ